MYVVKDRIWPMIGYDPHPGQVPIHHSPARHRVAACGRRFGKSRLGGNEFVPEAIYTYTNRNELQEQGKERIFWIVGPEYSDGEKEFRVTWNSFKKLDLPFDKPGSYNNPLSGFMHISLWKGLFQIHVQSSKYPDSLVGEGLSGVILAEAAKMKEIVWVKYLRPALADERGWSLQTSTPEGKNWFYEHWQRGQDPKYPNWASWRRPSWMNTVLYPGGRDDPEILEQQKDMTEPTFAQEIEASFTDFVGRVFKDFDEEIHVGDYPYNPQLPIYLATDYGWTDPFVVLGIQIDVFQNVYVCAEYRVTQHDTSEVIQDLLTRDQYGWARSARTIYPEPASPGDTNQLANALHLKVQGSTGGELKWRLEQIRKWLKYDPESEGHPEESRKPKLFIDRNCVGLPLGDGGLIREMQEYRYPERKKEAPNLKKDEPMDKDNHGPEALGRFFRGHFGSPGDAESDGRVRIRKVRVR